MEILKSVDLKRLFQVSITESTVYGIDIQSSKAISKLLKIQNPTAMEWIIPALKN